MKTYHEIRNYERVLKLMFKSLWQNVWSSYRVSERQSSPRSPTTISYTKSTLEEFLVDFIKGLSKCAGNIVIMVLVDQLTKYAHFCSLSHPFKENIVKRTFMEIIQKATWNSENYCK